MTPGRRAASHSDEQTLRTGVFVALGSNLGDREETLNAALDDLTADADIRVIARSSFHETDAIGGPAGQPRYLNAVVELATTLPPQALLERLLDIERRHGRTRSVPNAPRTLDLDLLLFGDSVINQPGLIVPHPRMWRREFVMAPLAEVCDVDSIKKRFAGVSHVR